MASLLGEAMISRQSDLSAAAVRLHPLDAVEKEGEEVEILKKELKEKQRESFRLYHETVKMIFEWNKMEFTRTLDKSWFTNKIIKERCRADCKKDADGLSSKALACNKHIVMAASLGLDGVMFGPSRKRKASSSVQEVNEASDEEDLEELRDLKNLHEEAVLQMVEADREEVREKCKLLYRRARPFAKLKDREEYLSSLVESLLEREREKEEPTKLEKSEERKPFVPTTPTEILGYMLLEETVNATLKNPYINLTPCTPPVPIIDKLEKYRNSLTLASIRGEEEPPKIELHVDHPTLCTLSGKWSLDELVAADYNYLLIKAKAAHNHSEKEQMTWMLVEVEREMEIRKMNCQDLFPKVLEKMSAIRSFEARLVVFCKDLSYMRYGRCLNAFSNIENGKLKEIRDLARKIIEKYREEKGPESIPVITKPVMPVYHTTM